MDKKLNAKYARLQMLDFSIFKDNQSIGAAVINQYTENRKGDRCTDTYNQT